MPWQHQILHTMESQLHNFKPLSLEQINTVKLMNRKDAKFILVINQLQSILPELFNKYRILEINKRLISDYRSIYYDTDNFEMYHNQHNRRVNRYKIRTRKYIDSNVTFLEIKHKNNKKKTDKKRIQITEENITNSVQKNFINDNSPYKVDQLSRQFSICYSRITLINLQEQERITIDINLQYKSEYDTIDLPGLVIIEIKKEETPERSAFAGILKQHKIYPYRISKYCIGQLLTNKQNIRYNRYKSKVLKLKKILSQKELMNV